MTKPIAPFLLAFAAFSWTVDGTKPGALSVTAGEAPIEWTQGKKKKAAAEGPFVRTLSGKIKLKKSFSSAPKLKLGNKLEAVARPHVTDWFDTKAISGQVDVENKTEQKIYTSYHLAFFDKKGELLGCASQDLDFDPGEKTSIGGAVIQMPPAQLAKVASYRLSWYEDTQKIGSR